MIEIIKQGNLDNDNAKYSNICPHCYCEYTYQKEDVYVDSLDRTQSVRCPCCGQSNIAAVPPINDIWSYDIIPHYLYGDANQN
jgi:hypothetical protein